MNSFIITSRSKEKRKTYIDTFCKDKKISQFDLTIMTTDEPSIGIAQVRAMQKTLFLKPYNSLEKMVVLEDAEKLTIEAQNALLKVLEEPPANTSIFLSCVSEASFLPTILSRCKVIPLKDEKETSSIDREALENDIATIRAGSISARLVLAEKLATGKETLPQWFEQIISLLREKLLEDSKDTTIAREIQLLQDTYTTMQSTNTNLRLLLEHTFLEV